MALVTVDMDRNITAAEPVISILIASVLSPLLKSRLLIGAERTVSPTADGMAISMAKRMARLVLAITAPFSFLATAPESDGMSEEERELAIASGTWTKSIYLLL